mmetsp:Transcript_26010/g.64209  ORF Transcript_26010/g.64209 Transcript_26010/m.64209 type:complete len:754 (-) Transcript_26010:71-2332(-)|eukprot:CAMPEP_0206229548 /NCGR_PEP_ID=MMETSP0047_2-20121206/9763_1 /ASSEMBLY_ACC=CAM_ASM_000192 /TAXON_ID=195065 /ORGANISM="Chroomonas mesostigmatica_cf, Strain CCMP1168" /LENGTH=753 /DNA_ID=CAMNT_0053652869 /DNA_START=24 /DNA_END=2285 /DNA_ORIENTATION=+
MLRAALVASCVLSLAEAFQTPHLGGAPQTLGRLQAARTPISQGLAGAATRRWRSLRPSVAAGRAPVCMAATTEAETSTPTERAPFLSRQPKAYALDPCPSDTPAIVVFTGFGDLRVHDNAALTAAATAKEVRGLFIFEPAALAKMSNRRIELVLSSVEELRASLAKFGIDLEVHVGSLANKISELKAELGGARVYAHDDPVEQAQSKLQSIRAGLADESSLYTWRSCVRMHAMAKKDDYSEYASSIHLSDDRPLSPSMESLEERLVENPTEPHPGKYPVPTLDELIGAANKVRSPELREAMEGCGSDYILGARHRGGEKLALSLWHDYRSMGYEKFAEEHLQADLKGGLEQVSMKARGVEGLAYGEPFARAFGELLALGCLSPGLVWQEAFRDRMDDPTTMLMPIPMGEWGQRTSRLALEGVEMREWHTLLADYDIETDSHREDGSYFQYKYYRWHGYLIRYAEGGKEDAPPILFVHGFGASADQWHKCMRELSPDYKVFAIDLIGFGHSEKPPVSYSQFMWEDLVRDFSLEVVGRPLFIGGNSIGGYTSLSAAAQLKSFCKGLILLNSAGRIIDNDTHTAENEKRGGTVKQTLRDKGVTEAKTPPPQWALDLAGRAIISFLRPNVESFCKKVYPNRPEEVGSRLVNNIVRDSKDPGGYSVLAAGFKLPPRADKNELLKEFGGKLLVTQGINDPLGGGVSRQRFEMYSKVHPEQDVRLVSIEAGHCPHDEAAPEVSTAVRKFVDDVCAGRDIK